MAYDSKFILREIRVLNRSFSPAGRQLMCGSFLEANLSKKDKNYYDLYVKIRGWATGLWDGHESIVEQGRHGKDHSEALLKYANIILKKKLCEETEFLSGKEIFLLLSSIYLHDIGMQTGWKERFPEISGSFGNLTKQERKKIRDEHAKTSGYVIRKFKDNIPAALSTELNDQEKTVIQKEMNEALAVICEMHKSERINSLFNSDFYKKFSKEENKPKIDFIACLLQFCDVLHMDKGRINETRFRTALEKFIKSTVTEFDYDHDDFIRFFSGHFVNSVDVDTTYHQCKTRIEINLKCQFSINEDYEYIINYFNNKYVKRLTRHKDDGFAIMSTYGFELIDQQRVVKIPADGRKIQIPDQLIDYIIDQISISDLNKKVKEKINTLIKANPKNPFLICLMKYLNEEKNLHISSIEEIPEAIVNPYIIDTIDVMVKAMNECLNMARESQRPEAEISNIFKLGVDMVGWLILLSIKPAWLGKQSRYGAIRIKIPVQTELSIELVCAALNQEKADFKWSYDQALSGKGKIKYGGIECGFDEPISDKVIVVKREIYKSICKEEAPQHYFKSGDKHIHDLILVERIMYQRRINLNMYILIDLSNHIEPMNHPGVFEQMTEDLQTEDGRQLLKEIVVFYTITDKETVFKISEEKLIDKLKVFFDIPKQFGIVLEG